MFSYLALSWQGTERSSDVFLRNMSFVKQYWKDATIVPLTTATLLLVFLHLTLSTQLSGRSSYYSTFS